MDSALGAGSAGSAKLLLEEGVPEETQERAAGWVLELFCCLACLHPSACNIAVYIIIIHIYCLKLILFNYLIEFCR